MTKNNRKTELAKQQANRERETERDRKSTTWVLKTNMRVSMGSERQIEAPKKTKAIQHPKTSTKPFEYAGKQNFWQGMNLTSPEA